jgi:hypothetical protein
VTEDPTIREPEDDDLVEVRPADQSGSEDDPGFDQEFPVVEDDPDDPDPTDF